MIESCPKCGAPKKGTSCPKCGLIFVKFDPEALERGVSDETRNLWTSVLNRWDDESAHAVFVEHSILAGDGAYAAGCYRKKGTDPLAEKYLARITERMEQHLFSQPRARRINPIRARLLGIMLIVIVLGAISWLFFSVIQ